MWLVVLIVLVWFVCCGVMFVGVGCVWVIVVVSDRVMRVRCSGFI